MPHKDLIGVKEDVTPVRDHPLDGEVLANALRFTHLIVDDLGEGLQFAFGVLEVLPIDVFMGGVGEDFVQGDEIAGNL